MPSKKYQVEKATKEKIKKLFAYRRLTDLLNESKLAKDLEFVNHLIDVQYQIYMLDAYLESHWEINKQELTVYREAIKISLSPIGYKPKKASALLREIEKYEKIERNCRKDKWPTKESFTKFYTAKSCDVRLIRHLIYKADPELKMLWKEDSWIYYDLIAEIHDDIADIEEDLNTVNGNRFLISILRKGADKTHAQYEKYLTRISEKAKSYFETKKEKGKNKQLAGWTAARAKETIRLLNAKVKSKTMDKLSKSLLLTHMN